jgi:hypothetical protein
MAYTQQDLDRIEKEIGSGAAEQQYGDNRVRKRSLADLLRIRAEIQAELATQQPPIRQVRFETSKGV